MKNIIDILIIGGGAAGLASAVSAANQNGCLNITIIDRMPKVGKKILATGNGRCNLSHENINSASYHGSVSPKNLLAEIPDIRLFFEDMGLFTYTDDEGRIYPLSNTAASVCDTLRFAALQKGVNLLTKVNCIEIKKKENCFFVQTDSGEIKAKAVVLACGGSAAPVHGSNGSGFILAEKLNMKINPPYPALCYLTADNTKSLDGIRLKCKAQLFKNNKPVRTELGEVQFTKKGLSGICIFNLSAELGADDCTEYTVKLDLAPNNTLEELKEMLCSAAASRSALEAQDCFSGIFNRAAVLYLLKKSEISIKKLGKDLTGNEIARLSGIAKSLDFKITGRGDFSSAQVTAGGVCGNEIDDDFMSKKINGLFLAGEILDIWGDCGGYNLHFAFASGIKAGVGAAHYALISEKEKEMKGGKRK